MRVSLSYKGKRGKYSYLYWGKRIFHYSALKFYGHKCLCGKLISASFVRKQSPVLTVVCVHIPELALNRVFEVLSERAQDFSYHGNTQGPVNCKATENSAAVTST